VSALAPVRFRPRRLRRPGQLPLGRSAAPTPARAGPTPGHGAVPTTLGRRLAGLWEELGAGAQAQCPMCGAQMSLSGGVGRCGSCGSELS
jgi:hypothetical protein